MNSALKPSAMSRANVVLPTPGGPHKIIECGSPDSKATRRGLAGAQQMLLPDNFVYGFGDSKQFRQRSL